MSPWLWLLAVPGLYGLHRLALRMEARGWIYYRKAGSGGALGGVLQDLEQHVRPQIRHVREVKQEQPGEEDPGGGPGPGRPRR
ncbi:MAG TPA: hypothetical protein VJ570_12275 [Holophagaceae bacterium]|nr:hypothetical protein [Holophagaceae bacterium]